MSNKLEGLPNIYYLNLDEEIGRRKYMEDQFEKWNISNVTRVSGSEYTPNNFEEWRHLLHFPEYFNKCHYQRLSITLSTLEIVRKWLEETNERYIILFEDDYDLNLIKYWHFDWKYFMNRIPYDWDCIQLGFETVRYIPFYLHTKSYRSFYGPVLLNRHFARKLINIHYIQQKYLLIKKYGEFPLSNTYRCLGIDHFFANVGKSYEIPLITQNPTLDKKPKKHHFACRDLYYWWWENERDKFSLEDFFSFGKPNDHEMTYAINLYDY